MLQSRLNYLMVLLHLLLILVDSASQSKAIVQSASWSSMRVTSPRRFCGARARVEITFTDIASSSGRGASPVGSSLHSEIQSWNFAVTIHMKLTSRRAS